MMIKIENMQGDLQKMAITPLGQEEKKDVFGSAQDMTTNE